MLLSPFPSHVGEENREKDEVNQVKSFFGRGEEI